MYHEITGISLQIGIRDKRNSYQKTASFKGNAKMANMWFLYMVFLITIRRLFHAKDIACTTDLNRWQNYSRTEWWTVAKVLFEICIRRLGLYFVLKFYQKILSTSCDFRLFVYKIYQWTVANSYRGANFNFSLTKTAWNQRIVFEINFENS